MLNTTPVITCIFHYVKQHRQLHFKRKEESVQVERKCWFVTLLRSLTRFTSCQHRQEAQHVHINKRIIHKILDKRLQNIRKRKRGSTNKKLLSKILEYINEVKTPPTGCSALDRYLRGGNGRRSLLSHSVP